MNEDVFAAASRSLHGELAGMLRSTWRRSAQQTRFDAPSDAERSKRRHRLAVGALLAAAALLVVGAMTVGMSLTLAGSGAIAATPARWKGTDIARALHRERHADAVQAFRVRGYATAYGRFAELADEGHAPSASIALAMVFHGPSMFGSEWSATSGQLRRWSALVAGDIGERAILIAEHDRGE